MVPERSMIARAAVLLVFVAGGCFDPRIPECRIRCGSGSPACPAGRSCESDGFCHAPGEPLCGAVADAPVTGADGPPADAAKPKCGDGLFAPGEICLANPTTFPLVGGAPTRIALGDFDDDDDLDLALAVPTGVVTVRNDWPDLVINSIEKLSSSGGIDSVQIDGAGGDEILVTDPIAMQLVVLSFAGKTLSKNPANLSVQPLGVDSGDLNSDGDMNAFVVANDSLRVFGTLTGMPPSVTITQGIDIGTTDVAAFSLGDDALLDVATISTDTSTIRLFRGGAGMLEDVGGITSSATLTGDLDAADLDGDGNDDLVAARFGGLDVHHGDGNGNFASSAILNGSNTSAVALGDLDQDGNLDFMFTDRDGDQLAVALANDDRSVRDIESFMTCDMPSDVAVADLDRDGDLDVIVACPTMTALWVYQYDR